MSALCVVLLWAFGALIGSASEPAQDPERVPPETLGDESCLDCHEDLAEGTSIHEPVVDEFCEACHTQPDGDLHQFDEIQNLAARCELCHDSFGTEGVHEPVAEGECGICHDPHRATRPFLLRGKSDGALCTVCHFDQTGAGRENVHGPVAVGACTACHAPHTSEHGSLLRVEKAELCLGCHEDMGQRLQSKPLLHSPVQEDCSSCHEAHASDHPFQLKVAGNQLCLECHQPIADAVGSASSVHGALESAHGCANCHDPHGGAFPKLLDSTVAENCLECHQDPMPREDGAELEGIGAKLAASASHHGPIREGDCAACHDPHATAVFSLLKKPYPQRFYAPYDSESYSLCFLCHEERAFLAPETDTLTGFRDGTRNLHFLHVSKEKKGRTCRACHETHASNLPRHVSESVPFGQWRYPLNYEITPTGGSCAPGCHTAQAYDRTTGP